MIDAAKKIRQEGMRSSFKSIYGAKRKPTENRRVHFKVAVDLPEGVSARDMNDLR